MDTSGNGRRATIIILLIIFIPISVVLFGMYAGRVVANIAVVIVFCGCHDVTAAAVLAAISNAALFGVYIKTLRMEIMLIMVVIIMVVVKTVASITLFNFCSWCRDCYFPFASA